MTGAQLSVAPGTSPGAIPPLRLNLGCGRDILEGWVNIDQVDHDGVDILWNLDNPGPGKFPHSPLVLHLPYEDQIVDEMRMIQVLEHINNPLPLMQELHRIAKPGAMLTVEVPYGSNDKAWEDPTHVRSFFLKSWGYYSQPFYENADYGYRGDWQPDCVKLMVDGPTYKGLDFDQLIDRVYHQRNIALSMTAELRAIHPIRKPLLKLVEPPDVRICLAWPNKIPDE